MSMRKEKPVIIAVNKWDAVEKDTYTIEQYKRDIARDLAFMDYAPSIYISAKTGQRLNKLFELVDNVYNNSHRRITTGMLNDCLREAVTAGRAPFRQGKKAQNILCNTGELCSADIRPICQWSKAHAFFISQIS